jgi:hypothetical protein
MYNEVLVNIRFAAKGNDQIQNSERRLIKNRNQRGKLELIISSLKKMANRTSHRYNRLPLLPSDPGGVQQELVVLACQCKDTMLCLIITSQ